MKIVWVEFLFFIFLAFYFLFRRNGFPDNIETYGLVSGLWTSTFALGAFIGPSVSGYLYDSIGFREAVLFIIILHAIVGIIVLITIFFERNPQPYKELNANEPLLRNHEKFFDKTWAISTEYLNVFVPVLFKWFFFLNQEIWIDKFKWELHVNRSTAYLSYDKRNGLQRLESQKLSIMVQVS